MRLQKRQEGKLLQRMEQGHLHRGSLKGGPDGTMSLNHLDRIVGWAEGSHTQSTR